MTRQEFKFSIDRYASLVASQTELISSLESLKFLLDNQSHGAEKIASHSVDHNECIFLLESVKSNSKFVEITELDEENRRMLRYAFRDWKEGVLETIRGSQLQSTLDKNDLLNIDNASGNLI